MTIPRVISLVILTYPERIFYYAMIDINIKGIMYGPLVNSQEDDYIGTNFKPYLAEDPSPANTFDVFNPRFAPISVKIKLLNYDGLHHYAHKYGMGSASVLYIQQDIANNQEVFRMSGKMSEISFDRWTFEFTLKDESSSLFIDQPYNVLKEDTFQTIKTIGPFDENPLRTFGLLVAFTPGPNGVVDTVAGAWPHVPADWPRFPVGDDVLDQLIAWIEHPDLYNEDDEYWVGSMISVVQDPLDLNVNPPPCRSGWNPIGGVGILNSKYSTAIPPVLPTPATSWPYGNTTEIWNLENISRKDGLWKTFSLGATAYVLKSGRKFTGALPGTNTYSNARWDDTNKRGRIWLDTYGPNVDNYAGRSDADADALMCADPMRRIPDGSLPGEPTSQMWANRTGGAKAMGAISNRHIIRIYRRPIPENADSVGKPIPIAYGMVRKGEAIHAIGSKAIGDEGVGCSDHYIICGHPMGVRVCSDNTDVLQNNIERIIQFREIKIWHSLDQTISASAKLENPAANNENEFGVRSQNPFPRTAANVYIWSDPGVSGPAYLASDELEPYVMWFNAGEDKDYRYRCYDTNQTPVYSRQIKLVDNEGNDTYSGIRLRGEDYWANVSYISLDTDALPDPEMAQNNKSPQYPIRNGLGNSKLYFDFNGEPDFDDGCITGIGPHGVLLGIGQIENIKNPGGLVQNPADIIAHFLLKYTKINGDRSKIDWPSFRKARGMLNGWRFASFLNEVKKGEDIIGQWQSQCRSILYYKNNRFFMRYIDLNSNRQVKYLFNDGNIDRGSLSVDFNGVGEIYNKFTIQYLFDRPHGTWERSIEFDSTNNTACKIAEQLYGATEHFQFDCPDVNDSRVAVMLANYFVELYTKQRLVVGLSAPINNDTLNINPGDLVIVQCEELPNRSKFERPNQRIINPARLPFIVYNITPNGNSSKYSLLQLYPRGTML
jgi:hypothetical protein